MQLSGRDGLRVSWIFSVLTEVGTCLRAWPRENRSGVREMIVCPTALNHPWLPVP